MDASPSELGVRELCTIIWATVFCLYSNRSPLMTICHARAAGNIELAFFASRRRDGKKRLVGAKSGLPFLFDTQVFDAIHSTHLNLAHGGRDILMRDFHEKGRFSEN